MAAPVLRLDGVSLAFGARPLLDNVTLLVEPGERVCIVGRNGEGKSSLMRLVNRVTPPDSGSVWVRPGAKLAFLAQDIVGQEDAPVREVVAGGLAAQGDHLEDWEIDYRVDTVLTRLGLDPEARYESLSGGWRRRALLGRALVCEPELLLLDEPTNHLDITTIEWLEEFLLEYRGALLFVSHDRRFVNRLATRIIDLDRGQLSSWPGNYDAYATKKAEQLANEARENALFDKKLAQEEAWIRKGVEARRTRNEGRVRALMACATNGASAATARLKANLQLQEASVSGQLVFEAEGAAVSFGDRTILRDFTTRIHARRPHRHRRPERRRQEHADPNCCSATSNRPRAASGAAPARGRVLRPAARAARPRTPGDGERRQAQDE
jgi:ABC transport system ATP-binding/permease protein